MKKTKKENLFEMNNYAVIKEALSKELAIYSYQYLLNKRKVARHFMKTKYISPFDTSHGHWNDTQIPNTFSIYGDVLMDTLLERTLPLMCSITKLELVCNYSYARIYKFGDELHRHKDRPECEISTTINLGGDAWPIYLEPTGLEGAKGIEVNLSPGDMLVYKGELLEHWREPFEGVDCGQVFLHYSDVNGPYGSDRMYDKREMLGLPSEFKRF